MSPLLLFVTWLQSIAVAKETKKTHPPEKLDFIYTQLKFSNWKQV